MDLAPLDLFPAGPFRGSTAVADGNVSGRVLCMRAVRRRRRARQRSDPGCYRGRGRGGRWPGAGGGVGRARTVAVTVEDHGDAVVELSLVIGVGRSAGRGGIVSCGGRRQGCGIRCGQCRGGGSPQAGSRRGGYCGLPCAAAVHRAGEGSGDHAHQDTGHCDPDALPDAPSTPPRRHVPPNHACRTQHAAAPDHTAHVYP
jgi:hypothetical protein